METTEKALNAQITTYDKKTSKALTGERLAVIRYKDRGENKAKSPSICVSLPPIGADEVAENIDLLLPTICNYLESTQDELVRQLHIDSGYQLETLNLASVSIPEIVKYIKETQQTRRGSKITKDTIAVWFDAWAGDLTYTLLANKFYPDIESDNYTAEQKGKLITYTDTYKALFSQCANVKVALGEKEIKSLEKILQTVADNSSENATEEPIFEFLIERLGVMKTASRVFEHLL